MVAPRKLPWKTITAALSTSFLVAACSSNPPSETTTEQRFYGDPDFDPDVAEYEAMISEFEARRDEYEVTGNPPPVPETLSDDPQDPNFEFLGYFDVEEPGTPDDPNWPPTNIPEETETQELEDELFQNVYVNVVGEAWLETVPNQEELIGLRDDARGGVSEYPASDFSDDGIGDGTIGPKTRNIHMNDDRTIRSSSSGHDMGATPWRNIGALIRPNPNPMQTNTVRPRCTAFKIGPRILGTAGHCLVSRGGGKEAVKPRSWAPGADGVARDTTGDFNFPLGRKLALWYVVPKEWLYDAKWNRDIGAIILYDNQHSCDLGWLGFKTDYSLAGTSSWNFGYPVEGKECEDSPLQDSDECGGSMYGHSALFTRTTASYAYSKHDMQEGHSGSPLYQMNGGDRRVVALFSNHYSAQENRHMKFRKLFFDFFEHQGKRSKGQSSHCSW